MRFLLKPGNLVACKINSHRSSWDGSVCEAAEHWNCSARQDFRENYCARGDDRCFHVRTFDASDPSMVIEQNGASWLLNEVPSALDRQILVFYGARATPPMGITDSDRREVLFGAYRIRSVEREDLGHRSQWRVRPFDDGWVCFAPLNVQRPRHETLGGAYLKQMDSDELRALLADERMLRTLDGNQQRRFQAFAGHLDEWLEEARRKARELADSLDAEPEVPPGSTRQAGLVSQPFSKIATLVKAKPQVTPIPAPPVSKAAAFACLEPDAAARIREAHGADLLLDLNVALATRDLIVLRGDPGVGKSHLALRLLDDPLRERTLVVPVSATWRGREDLLGYVNPMDGHFVRTPFTRFLERAAAAWRAGDRALRMVVFEEFNLSQPEHWFADVLAVSQYEDEADRIIQLAGDGSALDGAVFLSPALRFVGTVNSDHTTRALSPRVLDRAAIVHLELGPNEMLACVGLELADPLAKAIAELDFRLRRRGASFSIRTARSLKATLAAGLVTGPEEALDVVLAQQVLSKVRLSAHDPADGQLLEELGQWCDKQQAGLPRCVAMIADWRELFEAGLDVVQA